MSTKLYQSTNFLYKIRSGLFLFLTVQITLSTGKSIPYDYLVIATGGHFPPNLIVSNSDPGDKMPQHGGISIAQTFADIRSNELDYQVCIEI